MASVSSLDKDLRNLRLGKYTPQAANEARTWIEETLGEPITPGDLLNALKDGTVLCKLVNLATGPPGVRFKQSPMPFVQMENISHFLRACQSSPLNLQSHDIFQTVDLYDKKDPAQVLQCISAFSRRAHETTPNRFTTMLSGKSKIGTMSPQSTGSGSTYSRPRGISNSSAGSAVTPTLPSRNGGRRSPTRSSDSTSSVNGGTPISPPGNTSSWSKKTDEGATTPAWNIHQYGYMGGASQGNQGITFGGRRQITTPAPKVPSLAEKERKRREAEAEADRLRIQAEETEQKRRAEREAEEERERIAEQERWVEATKKQREQEQRRLEEEKRRWEEEERKWQEEEEARAQEERTAEARLERERMQKRAGSDSRLQGQFLSQYQAEQRQLAPNQTGEDPPARTAERERVKELERELAMAKEREKQYERERLERLTMDRGRSQNGLMTSDDRARSRSRPLPTAPRKPQDQVVPDQGQASERDSLRQEWSKYNDVDGPSSPELPQAPPQPPRPLRSPAPYQQPARNLHTPSATQSHPPPLADTQPPPQPPRPLPTPSPSLPARPLPDPKNYTNKSTTPSPSKQSQSMKPSPFAPKLPSSLLHREMELDRQRQQEWEEAQKATKEAAARGVGAGETIGPAGESWDVHQYGYLGGDSQNNVGTGIGFGARRQIMGPRPGPGGR
ncbi:MAG: hypothetical protein Q9195_003761 [Heterodermia aff. obscurata]